MLNIPANNPELKSWVTVIENSDFPIQNLPFGIIKNDQLTQIPDERLPQRR